MLAGREKIKLAAMDIAKIESLLSQMRAAHQRIEDRGQKTIMSASLRADTSVATQPGGADFSTVLKASLSQVNNAERSAEQLMQAFSAGAPGVHLHDAMMAMQKANVSFQAAVQVRNKLVSAYQDIMNMQI